MRRTIKKQTLKLLFLLDEFINKSSYFYMRDTLAITKKTVNLKMENKTGASAERLERFIMGIHARDKRIRVFNHFKQLKTDGKRRNSQRDRV